MASSTGFGQFTTYGSPGISKGAKATIEAPSDARRRINVISIFFCILVPLAIFMTVFGLLSFNLHYESPGLCWFIVIVALLAVVCFGIYAWVAQRRQSGDGNQPTWLIILFFSCLVAWVWAIIVGEWNYSSVMLPHFNMVTLSSYTNVDPGEISGTGVMDAGRLSFKAGTHIDTSKAIGFKNVDTYCAAPVTSSSVPLVTYDFWATGKNCCSGAPGDFHCGEVNGYLQLGGGVRVLDDAEISWLTLATQQAEALYNIQVGHAIFFKNVADPIGEESAQMGKGVKFFCLWSFLFFGIQFFVVTTMLVLFSREYSSL